MTARAERFSNPLHFLSAAIGLNPKHPLWADQRPIREELFGAERLEQHARSLAAAQPVTSRPPKVPHLNGRLKENVAVLLSAYRKTAGDAEGGRPIVPAAEWLLDNYHLVEEQVREIRDDLPIGYYRQLPKLAGGPLAGYPRVIGLAWAYVAHTDSYFDPEMLRRFLVAYQQVEPLTIGELWAVAISLRIVLVENLRRLADQITAGRQWRREADLLANQLLAAGDATVALDADFLTRSSEPLDEVFAAQLSKRLRDQDPRTTPGLAWLESRLAAQGASMESVVQHAQQRLGASNVSVRNVITSMRLISDIDWADLFESVSLVDSRLSARSPYAAMDFPTRDLYRGAIEQLARNSPVSELEVAGLALDAAAASRGAEEGGGEPAGDPGYYLIGHGRTAFEHTIGFRPPAKVRLTRLSIRLGIIGYVETILAVTLGLLALVLWAVSAAGLSGIWLAVFGIVGLLPASEVATALVNRGVALLFGCASLPGLELADGVPASQRTLVAVPTLLTHAADLEEQIEQLEVHYLSGAAGDLTFTLLADFPDADKEILPSDAPLLDQAAQAIARLNERHGPGPAGDRFLLLHRHRRFNPGESKWMGWERKRGKLHELNRLLRGAQDTSFMAIAGRAPWVPADVRYVITLDADTRLPRDAALRLIGKMAHPLNRPIFDPAAQRVTGGYGILQPRVTPSLPIGREGSFYQRVISGGGGMDPYAAAVSDVYQDLFGEGSYTGKGIYEVDAFEASLAGRIPDNTLLSHDLFEGMFARAGLASDVEVVEEFPSRYDVVARRQHRWMRGDWQLLPWLIGGRTVPSVVMPVGRWKMLDNLRRALLAPFTFLALWLCWLFPLPAALTGTALLVFALAVPALLPVLFNFMPRRPGLRVRSHFLQVLDDLRLAASQTLLSLAFLADQAWSAGDAAVRTLVRLFVTRRHLLEWTTAATSSAGPRLTLSGFGRQMAGGMGLVAFAAAGALLLAPGTWPLILPLALLWLAAPAVALAVSRSPSVPVRVAIDPSDAMALRLIARRTWRYFETFVTPDDNMLPPDNFQEVPRPVLAHRTSPTNIGLYLLSAVAARDFGWAGTVETLERLEATFATLKKLPRFRGHFFNWYGTRDLAPLPPDYVSSVDSGNLAGHLITLANACEEWTQTPLAPDALQGIADAHALACAACAALPSAGSPSARAVEEALSEIHGQLTGLQAAEVMTPVLKRLVDKAARLALQLAPATGEDPAADVAFWIEAIGRAVSSHDQDRLRLRTPDGSSGTSARLTALAAAARAMALEMDFAFLLDPERKLLSIGYALTENGLDPSCYDLLASEARLASLFAIAKGDAPTRHWFRLGRLATPLGNASALISWSGSMFEYLMPSLVMRAPSGSLLEQTNRLVVERQQAYGRFLGVPWGMSESAYNARDIEFTYQYGNFGVPGLGLKRGLSENIVVAPYATGLAAMVSPGLAVRNFDHLARMGACGRHGFYEALDFTRARVPDGEEVAIVRSFMAHHQGMTIVAAANTLRDGEMRNRFHREPMIRASELLLQERSPRDVFIARPRAEEVRAAAVVARDDSTTVRHLTLPLSGPPVTHLLSNGSYTVMLTAAGGGYSHWRDIAVTRWQEDTTRDDRGSFIFLRDLRRGTLWSPTSQPQGGDDAHGDVLFGEDHAEFIRQDAGLTTTMDVIVSGEHNGEVRRVCLTNTGRRAREIELTSYAELVLTTPAIDTAHPAFAKMFVQTEHLPEFSALVATRRPRAPGEPRIWAAHFMVVEGESAGAPQYETDRARFIGRGRTVATARAITDGTPLSETVGTVLDPIFSLRQSVRIAPGRSARIAFWTVVASTRDELMDLIDTHHDRNAFDRARTLAWTQAQVQLRHIDVELAEAADFQRLAAPLLCMDRRFRPASDIIVRGAGPQSGLWQHAISGDLPIVLMRIDEIEDIAQVRQLLRAREYWRMKRLAVDVVIINERAASYVQDLQIAIETAVRTQESRSQLGEAQVVGGVYVLRADLMSTESRHLLQSAARVVMLARGGPLAGQLARMGHASGAPLPHWPARPAPAQSKAKRPPPALEYFNGLGGFDKDGREYVTVLSKGDTTPAPWINVIANAGFGFQVSAEGCGFCWAGNSRENQLTQWSNDAVMDPPGEAFYVRDEATGELWSPTAQPLRDAGTYVARHGFGYSRFSHEVSGIDLDLLQFVPLDDPIKISRLTLTNLSGRPRRLSVTAYVDWVLGTSRGASAPFILTEIDPHSGAMFARNRWSTAFGSRVAFVDLCGRQTAWTADRTEFLGRGGDLASPLALAGSRPLSGITGAGLDPCAALQTVVELGIGESVEVVVLLGQGASLEQTRALIAAYRQADLDAPLAAVTAHWTQVLGAVKVKTPDRAMDIMLNGWLLYQTLACRITARSGFYQASGAYGFRDQLQDGMALTFAQPKETRAHIVRAAGRQFVEGDVQHWWLPQSGQGVRTSISDDVVWLAFATATYIESTADASILDEVIPFLEGPALQPGQHDAFFLPMPSEERGTLFEHCARALDRAVARTGALGMPLMGTGDWNDGMNRVGEGGNGESVWLGWLLIRTIELFAPLAEARDPERASRWRAHAQSVCRSIESSAWDGEWYRRATFDDGTWLGSKLNAECRIDSIAQSWAVLSGAADGSRAEVAMASLQRHLVRVEDGIAPLFTPPFDRTPLDPGYIKGYPPGLRENGGQYTHAAMWAVLAFAKLGAGDRAHGLFSLLNPITHARTPEEARRYKVEPYVVAADVYSVAPHVGRGGWSWYTGSAGWMQRAGIEGLLGLRRQGEWLLVEPCIPATWPGFSATVRLDGTVCRIEVRSGPAERDGAPAQVLDGQHGALPEGPVRIALDGRLHELLIWQGTR
ncbi:cyclic beta-1,2-glucan synthetase [Azorhizobium sp. AG788]|uniref:GH36-type glycosyl hydrolase domain-containing protein n=1 Tax=Azorhizobium sp. AG788 TaxID=2183897 RepID=UPI00105DF3C3|nr:glucoamylase family protein [Azorhizobium sp. AG788]TDT93708.1 cyclic beta-1,2-glucan synthetase [Azorhizobium sp. AG788]